MSELRTVPELLAVFETLPPLTLPELPVLALPPVARRRRRVASPPRAFPLVLLPPRPAAFAPFELVIVPPRFVTLPPMAVPAPPETALPPPGLAVRPLPPVALPEAVVPPRPPDAI